MEPLNFTDNKIIERFLKMQSGYVLDLNDRTFGDLVNSTLGIQINSDEYCVNGSSKANRLRTLFKLESSNSVATLLFAFVEYVKNVLEREDPDLERVIRIAKKLSVSEIKHSQGESMEYEYDAFICHASEDKSEVAQPLHQKLSDMGYKIWLDSMTLRIGDNLRRKIDEVDLNLGMAL